MSVDLIMAIVSLAMSYSLLPQLILSVKTKEVCISWQTVWITSVGMWIFVSCYARLHLWVAFVINCVMASFWTALLVMKFYYERKKHANLV